MQEAIRLITIVLAGLTIGLVSGQPLLSFTVTLLLTLIWYLFNLLRLNRLIKQRDDQASVPLKGVFGDILKTVQHQKGKSRRQKNYIKEFSTRFREASAAIPDAIVILEQDDKVAWANPAAKQLLGICWPEDVGKTIQDLVPYSYLNDYLQHSDFNEPLEFSPPCNKRIILSLQTTPFGSKQEQQLVIAREITQLYHLNQARRNFVSSVSHELKTPLTVISGFLETLEDAETLPHQKRPLELMQQQAQRMQSLVQDLLTLSRLEISDDVIEAENLVISDLIDKAVNDAKLLSGDKAHQFELDIDPNLQLLGNRKEIFSCFSNLLSNAVNYTPPESKINVTWSENETGAQFSVTDSGEGIAERHLPRLTERFYRIDTGRSRDSGGTGLGLAIVKHALYRHDAELRISSKPGIGSTFCCHFPAARVIHAK